MGAIRHRNRMGLYYVFTIDGDWDEYFWTKIPIEERYPHKETLLKLINYQIDVSSVIDGKFLHFVHTSPTSND